MWQFLYGLVLGAVVIGTVVLLYIRQKANSTQHGKEQHGRQLEEISKLTGELAHEIKNPLSIIKINLKLIGEELKSLSEVLGHEDDGQRVRRAIRKLGIIEQEADRLEQILDGFLRYIDKGKLDLSANDLNELMSDMIDFYSPQAYGHSITIRQSLHDKPLVCKVDANMLKKAILNIFINAQQAMESGGELMIRTSRQGGKAVIQINDTGCGIAADKLQYIFDAHYSSRPEGSGLGLPIVKKMIEAQAGTVDVSSEVGKGTSFVIKLPLNEG